MTNGCPRCGSEGREIPGSHDRMCFPCDQVFSFRDPEPGENLYAPNIHDAFIRAVEESGGKVEKMLWPASKRPFSIARLLSE